MSALSLLSGRFVIATLLVLFRLASRKTVSVPRGAAIKLILLGALGYALEAWLFFAALERAPAAIVQLVFYSYPVWTTLAGFAMGLERVNGRTLRRWPSAQRGS